MLPHKRISLATNNATNLKTIAGVIGGIIAINLTSAVKYLKIYDKATAPTVGTDVPVMTIPIPASTDGAGFVWNVPIELGNGVSYAITGAAADNDNTAVAAGDVIVNIAYN
jgi:hypothetical protein